jgi:hypothetical protein
MYILVFYSQQVKWNHFIMTSVCYILHIYSLFHRDETKPTHIIEINSFLFLMQLIYKHSSPNYQHMISYWKLINKIRHYIYIYAYVETFSTAFTSLPFVMYFIYMISSSFMWYSYNDHFKKLTKQLRQTFFFLIIYKLFHIANQLYQYNSTSRTITSSQHHPRESRSFFGRPNLYKKTYIVFAYYEFALSILI